MATTGTRFPGREQNLGEIMASHQWQPQVEEQSPQPSTSEYSLPEVVNYEMPGPSGEGTRGRRDERGLTKNQEGTRVGVGGWLTPVIPALWKAEVGGSPEVSS